MNRNMNLGLFIHRLDLKIGKGRRFPVSNKDLRKLFPVGGVLSLSDRNSSRHSQSPSPHHRNVDQEFQPDNATTTVPPLDTESGPRAVESVL